MSSHKALTKNYLLMIYFLYDIYRYSKQFNFYSMMIFTYDIIMIPCIARAKYTSYIIKLFMR